MMSVLEKGNSFTTGYWTPMNVKNARLYRITQAVKGHDKCKKHEGVEKSGCNLREKQINHNFKNVVD